LQLPHLTDSRDMMRCSVALGGFIYYLPVNYPPVRNLLKDFQ